MDSYEGVPAGAGLANPEVGVERETAQETTATPRSPSDKHASKLHGRLQKTKRAVQGTVVAAELFPLSNEGFRYGSAAYALTETHNPAVGAAVLGATTLLIEGAGALAASELLANKGANRVLEWVHKKADKKLHGATKIPAAGEVAIAMTLGTPALLTAKNAADPTRTVEQNRRHGLFTASWMAGIFAGEGELLGKAAYNYHDPKLWAANIVAAGGLASLIVWSKAQLNRGLNTPEQGTGDGRESSVSDFAVIEGQALSPKQIARSTEIYGAFRNQNDEAVKLGLYGDDPERALKDPRTVLIAQREDHDTRYLPLLVPAQDLEWYNMEVLGKIYGEQTPIYYYAHPPIPEDSASQALIKNAIQDKLDDGAVVITDKYESESPDSAFLSALRDELGVGYEMESFGSDDLPKKADTFAGPVIFEGVTEVNEASSLYEAYRKGVESGDFEDDPVNGVSLIETVDDNEAEEIWQVYETPFEKLGAEDPMYVGFDKETLIGILKNPGVAKIVKRVEGDIAALCFFVQDFAACPWFNEQFYKDRFPEYHDTNNILIFPGIVSDERRKGSSYSGQLIDLATKAYAKRGSNVLVTFECTEISTRYIPKIVTRAINNSGVGLVNGFEQPISTTTYLAFRKTK